MNKRIALAALAIALTAAAASAENDGVRRSGYSYLRAISGGVTVLSRWNGRVEARRNMPISAGDEIVVDEGGRAEIGLADGNLLQVGGGTSARFESLYAQQGESDDFSAIKLREGSVILSAVGANEDQIPRIDTDDATVYLSAGSRARVNADRRRGTVVIGRAGSVEVRTRQSTTTVRAGQYLSVRDGEDAEIERGSFSRDRFDLWSAERLEALYETRSASARYVDEGYASDVVALDGYGDWDYNSRYSSYVWSPRVEAGWSPYSYGSWYYTPAGLTWWSYDPWGWYPFHYGNWFFDSSWHRWCWSPANVYSPAWVYWAYTPSYVGWCPIGHYSFYSPWYDTYYRRWGLTDRAGLYISIRGTFPTRNVDFHAWNFVGAGSIGAAAARLEIIPGSRIADRLGTQVAISSRPIVVTSREGAAPQAIRDFVREAPRAIERTAATDSARLAPILARDRTLPPATVEALRERTVVAERGRLAGSTAADLAPRGAIVERGRAVAETGRREPIAIDRSRGAIEPGPARDTAGRVGAPAREPVTRGRTIEAPVGRTDAERSDARVIAPSGRTEEWQRARPAEARESTPREMARPAERRPEPEQRAPSNDWRSRARTVPPAESVSPSVSRPRESARAEEWRSRSEVPPARRVVEGAVRRPAEVRPEETRPREAPSQREAPPRVREREYRPESAPPPRAERAPAYSPPPRVERAPAYSPPPRAERAPSYSAPPPAPSRSEGRQHPAPPPRDRSRKAD